jgi:NAD(P)-dependent dehydrogenase (short-subunit alcohol dehydrogenase family)
LGREQAGSLFYFVFRRDVLMEAEFTEKVVLVTGATSGIGHAVAVKFAEASARVVALGRNQQALTEVENAAKSVGSQALALTVDVTNGDETRRAIDEAIDKFGRLDVLVNAAGHISSGSIETTSLAAWDAMMEVNLRSVFQLMQLATPHLIETKGNIVNVSSVTGLRSFPGVLAYCVSKAALDQLTRCAALELAPKGVRVNAVNPGVVVTEIHKRGGMSEADYEKFLEHSKTTHPLGRVGDPKEIAELIFYLASEKASWITGGTYQIDGGRALTCAR